MSYRFKIISQNYVQNTEINKMSA